MSVDAFVRDLEDEITALHMTAQGTNHYSGCANNAANTGVLIDECLRCQVERKDEALRAAVDALVVVSVDLNRLHGLIVCDLPCGTFDVHAKVDAALDACRAALGAK